LEGVEKLEYIESCWDTLSVFVVSLAAVMNAAALPVFLEDGLICYFRRGI